MPIEIRIGAPHITIHHGCNAFVSEPDGSVDPHSDKGLFFRDTRLISKWGVTACGSRWTLLNWANESFDSAKIVMLNEEITGRQNTAPPRTISLILTRSLQEGLRERFELANYGAADIEFDFEIEIASDFVDIFDVKKHAAVQRRGIKTEWSEVDQALANSYRKDDFYRKLRLRIEGDSRACYANGKIAFPITLKSGAEWRASLLYDFVDGDHLYASPTAPEKAFATNTRRIACFKSGDNDFDRIGAQAVEDIGALRLKAPMTSGEFFPAGGVPWFLTIFGRDSIISSLQFELVDPDFSLGALDVLASLQAGGTDDFQDAEPGKIPHELRHGELAHFHKVPQYPYYGTADATPLYLVLLHSAWKRSGDNELIERHLATAKRCLDWIDEFGDRDADGFQEYEKRSPQGYENQGWKDAGDAIVWPDGRNVEGPKALCELQGYVFDAWVRMAEIFDFLGHATQAVQLRHKAESLYRKFNEVFWDEDAGFYALALDGEKKKVMSIASNPGHCLWSGIVPSERAARLVERFFQPDMWSGWGIRTLSSRHRAFNPFSYQNGSVWPHDNSIIARGMKRYGFDAECHKVIRAVCDAAAYFTSNRLPELFAGTDRDRLSFPVRYIGANVPQAWASGAIFAFVQSLIDFEPDLPNGKVSFDANLPDWLPRLDIDGLQLGKHSIDICFWRDGGKTRTRVKNGELGAIEICSPTE